MNANVQEAEPISAVDLRTVAPKAWAHRNPNFKTRNAEFTTRDGRYIRTGFSTIEQGNHVPRHGHNFEQIRLIVDGQVNFGSATYGPGDCIYFPEGVEYGPTDAPDSSYTLYILQTNGSSGAAPLSRKQAEEAVERLTSRGIDVDASAGKVRWSDGRVQDSYTAAWEEIAGETLTLPAPRYSDVIALKTSAIAWNDLSIATGVQVQELATFGADGPSLKSFRLRPGATLPPSGAASSNRLFWVLDGQGRYGDNAVEPGWVIYEGPGSRQAQPVEATSDLQIFTVEYSVKS